ncbi:MAG TPA: autotransporter-associated beta strand repeat-containing protein [Thermoguttaceae bacterium]|nr:autotransporter-associated beta strand repeat-containing protein [Thermoguttaceae bacterium]
MISRFGGFGLFAASLALAILGLIPSEGSATVITWVGDGTTNAWDTSSPNWAGSLFNTYADGDDVTFDDTGSNAPDISLTPVGLFGLAPGSVTVNNGAGHDYVFAGTSYLQGSTGITKNGAGVLTVNTPNTFDGVVTVNAGTLKLGNAAALGSTVGGTVVNGGTTETPGGTLDLLGTKTLDEQITVQGVGVDGNGVLINTVSGTPVVNNLVLAGDATFGGSERVDIRVAPSFGNYTLTVNHTASTTPNNNGVRITGVGTMLTHDLKDANVVQGLLAFHSAGMGQADGTITVTHNPTTTNVSTLQLMRTFDYDTTWTLTKNLVFTGGRIHDWRGNYTLAGTMTLNANELVSQTEINVPTYHTTYKNALAIDSLITGTGGILKTGGGALTLQGVNTYSGNTTINGNKLILGASASISDSSVIDVLGTASTFDVSAVTAGFTLGGTQTLKGRGAVAGNVTAASGSTIEGGSAVIEGTSTGIGSLTFQNNLDMSAGANLNWELGALMDGTTGVAGTDFDQLAVTGNLTLGGTSTLTLDFDLLAETLRPDYATPDTFWTTDHTWTLVNVGDAGVTTGNFATLVNNVFAAGEFSVLFDTTDTDDVLLQFTAGSLLPPIPGDTGTDRIVDATDADVLAGNWGTNVGTAGRFAGDFNADQWVNALDASILAANWGNHNTESAVGVPEPSAIVLLFGAIALLFARRRSSR